MLSNLFELAEVKADLSNALSALSELDRDITKLYFGLDGHKKASIEIISNILGVSLSGVIISLKQRIEPHLRNSLKQYAEETTG